MADKKLSALTPSTTYSPANSYVVIVDESDTSQSATGSNYKVSVQDLTADVGLPSNFVFIAEKADFPAPSAGVITLAANTTYYITTTVDLTGDRLVGSQNTAMLGASSEVSRLTSTGLTAGVALLSSEYTMPCRYFTIQNVDTAINFDGKTFGGMALDWDGVNFLNVPNVGVIDQADNFIYDKGALLSSTGLRFEGSMGTVALNNSIFTGTGSAVNILELGSTLSLSRRFRVTYSSFVVFGATVGISVNAAATIPTEGFILDTLNFAAGGTYISGATVTDLKSRWVECRGIENTANVGGYSMVENQVETVIPAALTEVKVSGATSPYPSNQRFDHSDNRLTYTGALTRTFEVQATASLTCLSQNGRQVGLYLAKNGVPINESEAYTRTANAGDLVSSTIIYALELVPGDYIEVFIENFDNNRNLLVEYMNVICKALK